MTDLAVWMNDLRVGNLSSSRGRLRFRYEKDLVTERVGQPLLSVAMPVSSEPFDTQAATAFFENLLPEGEILRMLAYDFGLEETNTLGMLKELGRDCAGALQLRPHWERPDDPPGVLEPISDADVAKRLRSLRTSPLGIDERLRVSLAGMQEKMVLAKTKRGWALPLDGAPSTHILKPPHQLLPDTVANEALCMRIALYVGIETAEVEVRDFGDRPTLVVRRFDRVPSPSTSAEEALEGQVMRVHQEDMCQAHSVPPRKKYEASGGPSLRSCAAIISDWVQGQESLSKLLKLTVLNVLIGNADAHAKNLALLHEADGSLSLAPAFDLLSTRFYSQVDTTAGMFVNGKQDIDDISPADLASEAIGWGMPRGTAEAVVQQVAEGIPAAIERAASEIDAPEELVALIRARTDRFLE